MQRHLVRAHNLCRSVQRIRHYSIIPPPNVQNSFRYHYRYPIAIVAVGGLLALLAGPEFLSSNPSFREVGKGLQQLDDKETAELKKAKEQGGTRKFVVAGIECDCADEDDDAYVHLHNIKREHDTLERLTLAEKLWQRSDTTQEDKAIDKAAFERNWNEQQKAEARKAFQMRKLEMTEKHTHLMEGRHEMGQKGMGGKMHTGRLPTL